MALTKYTNFPLLAHSLVARLKSDSLLRNSVFIMCSTVITSGIGYFYWILAAHIYTAYDVGLASAFISAMTLTSIFTTQGMGTAMVQLLPKRKTDREWSLTFNLCLTLGISTSLFGGIIVALVLPFLSSQFAIANYYTAYIFIFIAGVALCTVTTLLDQTFVAERSSGNMAVRNAAFALLKLLIMIPLIHIGSLGIFSSWVLALAITIIFAASILIPRLKRRYHLAIHGAREQIRPLLSSFTGNHFISIGGILPMYLLPVFVAIRLSATDNAYFYTTWMMCSVFFMVSPSVATALFSEGSRTVSNIMAKARSSLKIISLLLAPILVVFLLGGHYLLSLFGSNYPQHGSVLLILLAVSAGPDAVTNIYVSLLRVQGRLQSAALLNLGMATITLVLAWFLLPTLGIAGAGWAWLIGQSAGSVVVGADFLIFHSYARSTAIEKEVAAPMPLPIEQNYAVTQAIWLMDTTVLPALKLSSISQSMKLPSISSTRREKDLSSMETAAFPTTKPPSTNQPQRKRSRSVYKRVILQRNEEDASILYKVPTNLIDEKTENS